MSKTIYAATNDKRRFIEILREVPEDGYIWTGSHFIRKTGWRSSKMIDWRHIDHEPNTQELMDYALEMAKGEAFYQAARVAVEPIANMLTAQNIGLGEVPYSNGY